MPLSHHIYLVVSPFLLQCVARWVWPPRLCPVLLVFCLSWPLGTGYLVASPLFADIFIISCATVSLLYLVKTTLMIRTMLYVFAA